MFLSSSGVNGNHTFETLICCVSGKMRHAFSKICFHFETVHAVHAVHVMFSEAWLKY